MNSISVAAEMLLSELEEKFLAVDLIPAPDPQHVGQMIRVSINQNPDWYRYLWDLHGRISRRVLIKALERIRDRGDLDLNYKYEGYLEGILLQTEKKIDSEAFAEAVQTFDYESTESNNS